jgi:cytochrome c oxidase subunit 3
VNTHHDALGDRFGMWLFLFSEILLFGALFVIYGAYFKQYKVDFINSGAKLDLFFGTFNTVALLISSFTVAASITALRRGKNTLAQWFLGFSVAVAGLFLFNKYMEWGSKIHHGIFPNSEWMKEQSFGTNLFFGLYYVTTGLHALHVIIGATLLIVCMAFIARKKVPQKSPTLLENCGLYWHLVDLIWIFVFPLFYLSH